MLASVDPDTAVAPFAPRGDSRAASLRERGVRAWRRVRRLVERELHPWRRACARRRLARLARVRGILVLCHGNVCRSPFAAAVLRAQVCVPVASAGFIGAGRAVPRAGADAAAVHHVDLDLHRSRLVTPALLSAADLVVVMDGAQARAARRLSAGAAVVVLGDLDPERPESRGIDDPWGASPEIFQQVYGRIARCCRQLARAMPALILLVLSATAGCATGDDMTILPAAGAIDSTLAEVTDAEWTRLAGRRIFFGHQSVGDNLMDGVAELVAGNARARLRVERDAHPTFARGGVLAHARIGRNHDPASKAAAFLDALDAGTTPDVALYKLCYVDLGPTGDPDALFAEYERTVRRARERHPSTTIVHVTMPLTTARPARGMRAVARRLLGRASSSEIASNVNRNRYNALLRARFADREPVFDLARIESTRADGSRSFFLRGDDTVFTLAAELTTDGGHLNPRGRRAAAVQLLTLLARL